MTVQNNTPVPATGDARAARSEAYEAARAGAALFDRSSEGRLLVKGADRASWLQGLLTNDVQALEAGRGCYAAYLTPQGRMLTDLRVLALADAFLLDLPASTVEAIRDRLEMFVITEDVTIEDVTSSLARWSVHGPGASACVASAVADPLLTASSLSALDEHASRTASFATGEGVIIAGARDLGEPGLDLYVPAPHAASLADRLRTAGAADGDPGTWETLRIEAGRPAFGLDMNAETIPLEAGIEDRAISFTKGCYVGQEVIIRVVHRGQGRVARHLVGLACVAPQEGEPGTRQPLSAGDVVMDVNGERRIGQITSAVFSPRLQTTIALGYVSRDVVEPGTRVVASNAAGTHLMEVRPLPFVRGS